MSSSKRAPTRSNILLPGESYVIKAWKVKPDALVRPGETIAMAWTKEAAAGAASQSSTGSSSTSSAPTTAKTSGHKRPNRRRKMNMAAIKASTDQSVKQANRSLSSDSTTTISNFQQRLAQKLSSSDSSTKENNSEQEGKVDSEGSSSSDFPKATSPVHPPSIPIHAAATGLLHLGRDPAAILDDTEEKLVVGYIEECQHPAFLDGLCVVCGDSMRPSEDGSDDMKTIPGPYEPPSKEITTTSSKGNQNRSQVTVSGGITMTVSAEEGQAMANRDIERLRQQAKLSLVLDLDHTLVHATGDPRARQYYHKDDVRTLRLPLMEGTPNQQAEEASPHPPMYMQHCVKLRPHIKTFLKSVQPDYELTVYTAGTRKYAEEITIMLCRHMVGAKHDIEGLEQLRYQVHVAQAEYTKLQSLNETKQINLDSDGVDHSESDRKRKAEKAATTTNGEPAPKRKKVSFGAPEDEPKDSTATESSSSTPKSDHVTKETLDSLKTELSEAEELEKEAWELRQKMFGSRVVSRTDVGDLGKDVKSLRRIFPCGGTMAAVVDDREDVWANAKDNSTETIKGEPPHNLLLVRPYHWQPFLGFADVNNAAGADLSGSRPDDGEDPNVEKDVQLVWTSRILKGLHRRYYRQDENSRKTVPELLAQMRSQVLRGSTMVLSGLVPLHRKNFDASRARPPIMRYAQSLGASLVDQVRDGVTHVVAAKDGTDKCLAARKTPGCVLVKASWLVECYWSMTRRDVTMHLLADGGPAVPKHAASQAAEPPSQEKSLVLADDDSNADSDSEDDDLAAEFAGDFMSS